MNFQAPFILISFDKDLTSSFFIQSLESGSILKTKILSNNQDVFLYGGSVNNNIISLNHKFGQNSAGLITLTILDPDQTFESRLVESDFRILQNIFNEAPNTNKDENLQSSIESTKKEFKKVKTDFSKKARTLYISYGIGTDIKNWAGPFETKIIATEIDLKGSKIIKLTLCPTDHELIQTNYTKAIKRFSPKNNYRGNSILVEGNSTPIDFSQNIDFHKVIVETLEDYLKKALRSNRVSVLLPDLNQLLSDLIVSAETSLIQSANQFPSFPKAKRYFVLNYVLNELGIRIVRKLKNVDPVYPSITSTQQNQSGSVAAGGPNSRLDNYFDDYVYTANVSTVFKPGDEIDYKKSLSAFFNNLKQNINDYPNFNASIYYENNLNVLDYWSSSELSNNRLFKNIKSNSIGCAIIVGEKTLISKFLLGNRDNNNVGLSKIHKDDLDILTDNSYKEKIRKLSKLEVDKQSLYAGIYSYTPDIFALAEDLDSLSTPDQSLKTKIENNNSMPLFKYNLKNPNVTKLTYNSNSLYLANLDNDYTKDIATLVSFRKAASLLDQFLSNNQYDEAAFKSYVDSSLQNNLDSTEEIFLKSAELENILKANQNINEIATVFSSYFESKLQDPGTRPSILISAGITRNINALDFEVAKKQYEQSQFISIETLPYFHIGTSHLLSNCALFADIPGIINPYYKKSLLSKTLSGIYSILEFEHNITNKNCSSRFSITKLPNLLTEEMSLQESFDL